MKIKRLNDMKEIERKWIIKNIPKNIKYLSIVEIEQGYIYDGVRIRKIVSMNGDLVKYNLCIKKGKGLVRDEIEINIDENEYYKFENIVEKEIQKTRKCVSHDKYIIEIDLIHGRDLILAEIEFKSEEEANKFIAPEWFDKDVTGISEFSNYNLAK